MLNNVLPRRDVKGLSRQKARSEVWLTVKPDEIGEYSATGWQVRRRNRRSVSLKKPKSKPDLLESRVWTLLYHMGFTHLSGKGGAILTLGRNGNGPSQQVDVVAIDDEVALAIECKSYEKPKPDSRFSEKLTKLSSIRGKFARSVSELVPVDEDDRKVATVMFVWDLLRRGSDDQRAGEEAVRIFDVLDLEYYEELVKHVGVAARYQFLSEVFKGSLVKGLTIKVPALMTRIGKLVCYTFAVRPDYLLKIAYIAHRAKGKPFDVDAYQRMISKTRLAKIYEFISEDGIFPTNIVLNIEDPRHTRFDKSAQIGDDIGGTVGWLTLTPAYGSAWVIDGQHRLYAYSGHPRALTSFLNVLAFQGLPPARQTELFVEINSEQRRVKRSLLVELDATLKWDDENEEKRIHAIISKAGMALDQLPSSPLVGRILLADVRRTKLRCISLTAIASALRRPGFYLISKKVGQVTRYGPLWRDDPNQALKRTVAVLTGWLGEVANQASDWWAVGSDEGGGLAMNDGTTVCINVLRSALDHLDVRGDLVLLDDEDLVERLSPYAKALGGHFARMNMEDRAMFRRLRGVQGQTTGTMMAFESLSNAFPDFKPDGLVDWLERRKINTNEAARQIIDRIERTIQARVIEELKSEYQADENDWWFSGIPKAVRKQVDDRINEIGGGRREDHFDLLHYEAMVQFQWELFKPLFAFGDSPNIGKQKGTAWLREIGDMRNKVMHPSRNDFLSINELQQLEMYEELLKDKLRDNS